MPLTEFGSAGNYPAGSDDWSGQPRKVALTNVEAANGFTPNAPIPAEVLNYLIACALPDVQTITANGVWTKPAHAQLVKIRMIGKGGPGGNGGSNTQGGGGGGGSSGEMRELILPASELPATLTATITGLVDPISGLTGMVRLSGTDVQIDARPGYGGGNVIGTTGGNGGTFVSPDPEDGTGGAGGNAAVGGAGSGLSHMRHVAGGGGGGDDGFAGGAGGRGDCNVGRGPSAASVGGLGGRGYGAGAGGGGGSPNAVSGGGGGGSGGSGIGSQLLAPAGAFGIGNVGGLGATAGADGAIIITTWRGIP